MGYINLKQISAFLCLVCLLFFSANAWAATASDNNIRSVLEKGERHAVLKMLKEGVYLLEKPSSASSLAKQLLVSKNQNSCRAFIRENSVIPLKEGSLSKKDYDKLLGLFLQGNKWRFDRTRYDSAGREHDYEIIIRHLGVTKQFIFGDNEFELHPELKIMVDTIKEVVSRKVRSLSESSVIVAGGNGDPMWSSITKIVQKKGIARIIKEEILSEVVSGEVVRRKRCYAGVVPAKTYKEFWGKLEAINVWEIKVAKNKFELISNMQSYSFYFQKSDRENKFLAFVPNDIKACNYVIVLVGELSDKYAKIVKEERQRR